VVTSWSIFWSKCKTSLSGIARVCFLGRCRWKERALRAQKRIGSLESQLAATQQRVVGAEKDCVELRMVNEELQQSIQELKVQVRSKDIRLIKELIASERPAGMQYSAKFIELAINLARIAGLRTSVRVMECFFQWLDLKDVPISSYQSIRIWMQRAGLHRMSNAKKYDGGAWIVDHTVQNGKEKVLVIHRVRESRLSKPGPLKAKDLETLTLSVGVSWTKEEVVDVYHSVAKKYGIPSLLICDGADNLRNAVDLMEIDRAKRPVVMRDVKHFLANRFENILTQDEKFAEFTPLLKASNAAVKQTEMAHFTPRSIRNKSRFMNMAPVIEWGRMMLWQIKHPGSKARADITKERFDSKLFWVSDFRTPIGRWYQCQQIIDTTLEMIAQGSIQEGKWKEVAKAIRPLAKSKVARTLVGDILEFLKKQEEPLRPGQFAIMSTEILESSLSSYKTLEKQHSKQGFSSLIMTLPVLLKKISATEILHAFKTTKVEDVREWTKTQIGTTLHARRQQAFKESRPRKQPAINRILATT
jgi:hypothetical protein